jgi:hypothetical protein
MSYCPAAPFEPLRLHGESVTVETDGKILVLPTGNADVLSGWNEYTIGRAQLAAGEHEFSEADLQNLIYSWIAFYDPSKNEMDFILFTHKPKKLKCVVDATGIITQLILYPGNGLLYRGSVTHCNLTLDTNYDLVPDCLKTDIHFVTADSQIFTTDDGAYFDVKYQKGGSLFDFLKSHGMVI